MFIKWCDEFNIGIEEIDQEHQSIFNHFEILYNQMHDGKGHDYYNELLEFIDKYVNTHFEHEEAFQKKMGYPNYEQHCMIHSEFKKKLFEIEEAAKNQVVKNQALIEINLFLKNWIIHHILDEDMRYAQFYHDQKNNSNE